MSGFFAMIKQSLNMGASAAGKISGKNIDMEALQAEVAAVIKKYIKCAEKPASLALKQDGEFDYLEMHFPLEQNSLASQQIAVNLKKTVHATNHA